jgi:hypothetical protein
MKQLFYISLFAIVSGCGQPESINSRGNDNTQQEGRYSDLLAQYKALAIKDTLWVFSEGEFIHTNIYSGTAIDSSLAPLFPKEIVQASFSEQPSLFAIYQFKIDNNRLGLITRTPSEYLPSSIKLFIFDKAKDSITSYIELAENIGDAGDVSIKNSWLFRNKDSQLQALIAVTDLHYNSADNPHDTTVVKDAHFYLLDLSKHLIDTISDNKKQLAQQYAGLLESQQEPGRRQ